MLADVSDHGFLGTGVPLTPLEVRGSSDCLELQPFHARGEVAAAQI
jgi:hypothetical protein